MSETFIKIDLMQHLEISRQTYPTNRSKICVTTFTVLIRENGKTEKGRFRLRISQNKKISRLKLSRIILMGKTGVKLLIFK